MTLRINHLKEQFPQGKVLHYEKDHIICDIHRKVKTFRWLLEGTIDYFIALEEQDQEIMVCQISEPYTTIGLNGLHIPKRYTFKTVVSTATATFFEIPISDLEEYIVNDQENTMVIDICGKLYHLLRAALLRQTDLLQPVRFNSVDEDQEFFITPASEKAEIIALMRRSPFLDQFNEKALSNIAAKAERRDYEPDEVLYLQDRFTNGLYILIQGEVEIKRIEKNIEISQRSMSSPGFIFGWSGLMGEKDICSAITSQKTAVYFVSRKDCLALLQKNTEFGSQFYTRLLWLIGNQINAAFIRYVGLLGKHNLQAVFQLINNNKSRLLLSSPLHQVSHLLKNTNTKDIAYAILQDVVNTGTSLERHISSLSLELLREDKKEIDFINGLQNIYQVVAENGDITTEEARRTCAEATKKAFQHANYHIEGLTYLPKESGHIFIYNHLINDPHYTLNNNFQITLDSHFISAMLLHDTYGESGIRTVRVGKRQEYGHQNYYNNLGYINVYTKESEPNTAQDPKASRSVFYREASEQLQQGYNLIISPEGTSYSSLESPGPFKMGAFKLALKSNPEPYIVPIVMLNFDHRIGNQLYYCRIRPPFKVSEQLEEQTDAALYKFVNNYQETYKGYVEEARKDVVQLQSDALTSKNLENPPEIWHNEIRRLRRRVNKKENQEDLITFYGSSSIRLWVSMQKDLAPLNILNLGFGGSSYAWCLHYFNEIFKDVHPKRIVLYAGENDLAEGKTPLEVISDCKNLVNTIKEKYPEVLLSFISLKPSVEREAMIPAIIETNLLLSKYVITELKAQFINVFAQMITVNNTPIPELYISDGLHLNKKGYAVWSNCIKEALLLAETEEVKTQIIS